MIDIKTNEIQSILNKVNFKDNFTHNLNNNEGRYIVSIKNLYTGKNPSIKSNLILTIKDALKDFQNYSSLGGWHDKKTNLYYLDVNIHFNDINLALKAARQAKQIAIFDKLEKQLIYLNN